MGAWCHQLSCSYVVELHCSGAWYMVQRYLAAVEHPRDAAGMLQYSKFTGLCPRQSQPRYPELVLSHLALSIALAFI